MSARDVLGHDDRVVDHEAGRDGERHQRQVVDAVAEQVHHAERADERQRHGDARDRRSRARAQEDEDDEHDEHDAEDERVLDVVAPTRGWSASGRCAISILIAGEIDVRELGQERRARARLVSMMFAPGCRRMMISTARLPSAQPATRLFSTSSKTSATSSELRPSPAVLRDDERLVARGRRRAGRWRRCVDACVAPTMRALGLVDRRRAERARGRRPSSGPSPASAAGSTCTRTAGCWPPPTNTCPTPCTCEIFCARIVLAASKTSAERQRVARQREDEDRRVGRVHLPVGRLERQVRRELAAGGGDGRLDVARGGVDVAVEIELQRDRRRRRACSSRSSR